jgi:hypothetical protein
MNPAELIRLEDLNHRLDVAKRIRKKDINFIKEELKDEFTEEEINAEWYRLEADSFFMQATQLEEM